MLKQAQKRALGLFAIVVVAAMALVLMASAALAGETGDEGSGNEATHGYAYEIYQVFTGDSNDDGVLSNVKWGQSAQHPDGQTPIVVGNSVSDDVLAALVAAGGDPDSERLETIEKYVDYNKPYEEGEGENAQAPVPDESDGVVTYSNLPAGYYVVKVTDNSNTATTFVARVTKNGELKFAHKDDVPTVDKKILETSTGDDGQIATEEKDNNEASIGDIVKYQIKGTLPTNLNDYKTYYYVFTDKLSKGLDYVEGSVKVTVDDVDVTKYFYTHASEYSADEGTTITVGIQDLLALNLLKDANGNQLLTVNSNSKVVITYSAQLNTNAVIARDGNDNKVALEYSNDYSNSGEGTTTPPPENPDEPKPTHPTGKTPESTVTTYTTELTILKTDENDNVLQGAEFTLNGKGVNIVGVTTETYVEDKNGTYYKLKDGTYTTTAPTITEEDGDGNTTVAGNEADYDDVTKTYSIKTVIEYKSADQTNHTVAGAVDKDGHVTFSGLGAGEYTITETKTPSGYNTISPINFTIDFAMVTSEGSSEVGPTFRVKDVTDNHVITVDSDNTLATTIVNKSGFQLPTTGGIGTTVFYIVGGVLVVGAAVLLVTRRRVNSGK